QVQLQRARLRALLQRAQASQARLSPARWLEEPKPQVWLRPEEPQVWLRPEESQAPPCSARAQEWRRVAPPERGGRLCTSRLGSARRRHRANQLISVKEHRGTCS